MKQPKPLRPIYLAMLEEARLKHKTGLLMNHSSMLVKITLKEEIMDPTYLDQRNFNRHSMMFTMKSILKIRMNIEPFMFV